MEDHTTLPATTTNLVKESRQEEEEHASKRNCSGLDMPRNTKPRTIPADATSALMAATPPPTHSHVLVLMRGLPGSGKSHFAAAVAACNPEHSVICSADAYFVDEEDGVYRFDPSQLKQAHEQCQMMCDSAMRVGVPLIVVDNTCSRRWEYERYEQLARDCEHLYRYHVRILEVHCADLRVARKFNQRCSHDVSIEATCAMFERWEPDARAILLEPYGLAGTAGTATSSRKNQGVVVAATTTTTATANTLLSSSSATVTAAEGSAVATSVSTTVTSTVGSPLHDDDNDDNNNGVADKRKREGEDEEAIVHSDHSDAEHEQTMEIFLECRRRREELEQVKKQMGGGGGSFRGNTYFRGGGRGGGGDGGGGQSYYHPNQQQPARRPLPYWIHHVSDHPLPPPDVFIPGGAAGAAPTQNAL